MLSLTPIVPLSTRCKPPLVSLRYCVCVCVNVLFSLFPQVCASSQRRSLTQEEKHENTLLPARSQVTIGGGIFVSYSVGRRGKQKQENVPREEQAHLLLLSVGRPMPPAVILPCSLAHSCPSILILHLIGRLSYKNLLTFLSQTEDARPTPRPREGSGEEMEWRDSFLVISSVWAASSNLKR